MEAPDSHFYLACALIHEQHHPTARGAVKLSCPSQHLTFKVISSFKKSRFAGQSKPINRLVLYLLVDLHYIFIEY